MLRADEILEELAEENPKALLADGFEDAFIGVARVHSKPPLVAYSCAACVKILMQRDGMTWEEAEEYFNFNVLQAHVGEGTPVFVDDM